MLYTLGYVAEYILYFSLLAFIVTLMSRRLNITPAQHRYQTLDGVRGVCATLVVIFHLYWRGGQADDNAWSLEGIENATTVHFVGLTGELAVGFFFMLSGFLFFRKALSENLNIPQFFVGRIKRIYFPLLIALTMMYILTWLVGPGPREGFFVAVYRALPVISELQPVGMNGVGFASAGIGLNWTLVWEARLYCVIPLLYWGLKPLTLRQKRWVVIGAMVAVYFVNAKIASYREWAFIMYFLGGFLVATIDKSSNPDEEEKWSSWTGLLILVVALYYTPYAYDTMTAVYMTIVFYTIKRGCDYFGFLTSRPVALLGTCSFSIYITHGIIEYVAKHYLYTMGHYIWQIASLVIIGIIGPLMYHYVERRCIR